MSFVTRSGMPALSQETREKVESEYAHYYDSIRHLSGLKDFDRLYFPKYEDFRREDIINTSHPLQNQIEQHALEIEGDDDHHKKITSKYNSNVISKEEYDYEMALLHLKEMKREGIFNITKAFKGRIANQEKEVEVLKQLFLSPNVIIEEVDDAVVEEREEAGC